MPKENEVKSNGMTYKRLDILKGISLMLFCQFFSASSLNLVKISSHYIHPIVMTWLIFSICFVFLLIHQCLLKNTFSITTNHFYTHFIRSTLGGVYFAMLFYAAHLIPTAESITLRGTAPIWLCLISLIILKKSISLRVLLAVFLGFLGITLVLHPNFEKTNIGYFLALGSGLCFSINALLTHKLSNHQEPYERILFYTFLIPTMILSPYALTHLPAELMHSTLALHILFAALCIFLVYIFYIHSLALAPPIIILPLSNIGVLFAGLYDWLIWGHIPHPSTLLGMIIVIISCIYIALKPSPNSY